MNLLLSLALLAASAAPFPRIANLWGMTAASTDYDRWARYGMLVMGSAPPQAWRRFSSEVRRRNPSIRLLGTGQFMNLSDPTSMPWMKDEWFLRRPDGSIIRWWDDQIVLPNILRDDCLDALVENVAREYDAVLKEGVADGLFFDSVVGRATWLGDVDTDHDGRADPAAETDARWHARQCLFFDRLRARWPKALILANDVDLAHAPHLHGRLFEGLPLLQRVTDGDLSGMDAVKEMQTWLTASLQPPVTFAIMTHPLGYQGWRVGRGERVTTKGETERVRRDFRRMRAGLTMVLMTDAYFATDFGTTWYGLPWRYAEYEAPLGNALGPAREVTLGKPIVKLAWQTGKPIGPMVLDAAARATPLGIQVRCADPESGWQRVIGTNPRKLDIKPGKAYRIEADCLVVRKPTGALQFNARTAAGGWQSHDKGRALCNVGDGETWRIDTVVVPDAFDDYSIEWHLLGAGEFRLTRFRVTLLDECYLRRDFEGGIALFNPLPTPVRAKLGAAMRRLRDTTAPRYVVEVDDGDVGFSARGAWERISEEGRYVGSTHRRALKPGSRADWVFSAPSSDRYYLYACIPGGQALSDGASYAIRPASAPRAVTAVVNQRTGDGGWVRLGGVSLKVGERCRVTLTSGGVGATVADAVRAESTARYNDGATVREVTIPPVDGVVLLR